MIIVFTVRFTRSTGFACAWYGGIVVCATPLLLRKLSRALFLNFVPLSEWNTSGTPKRRKMRCSSSLWMVCAFALRIGTQEDQQVFISTRGLWERSHNIPRYNLLRAERAVAAHEASQRSLLHFALLANQTVTHKVRDIFAQRRPVIVERETRMLFCSA